MRRRLESWTRSATETGNFTVKSEVMVTDPTPTAMRICRPLWEIGLGKTPPVPLSCPTLQLGGFKAKERTAP